MSHHLKPAPQEIRGCDWLRWLSQKNYGSPCPVKLIRFCFHIHTLQKYIFIYIET